MTICDKAAAKGMSDHKIAFSRAHFKKGVNVTFRNGDKWKKKLNPGDTLLLLDSGGTPINNGRVFMTEILNKNKWKAAFEFLSRFANDPVCRTVEGMEKSLDEAYGKGNWGPTITAIAFTIDDIDPQSHHGHSEKHYTGE